MNYSRLEKHDIANGPGIRVSLWVSGCNRHCPGCFNKDTWNFDSGEPFTADTVNEIIEALYEPYISGFSILGGEPLAPENVEQVRALLYLLDHEFDGQLNVWMWTGYKYEDVKSLEALRYVNTLVDGPFVEELHDISLTWKGSSNQQIHTLR